MKYIRGPQTYKIDDMPKEKLRVHINGKDGEGIWVAQSEDHCVLLNDSLSFMPYRSWGLVLPVSSTTSEHRSEFDLGTIRKDDPDDCVLTMHPEAYDAMLKEKIIDKEGLFIEPPEEEEKLELEATVH